MRIDLLDVFQLENLLLTYSPHAVLVVIAVDQTDSFQLAEHILLYLSHHGYIERKVVCVRGRSHQILIRLPGRYSCG